MSQYIFYILTLTGAEETIYLPSPTLHMARMDAERLMAPGSKIVDWQVYPIYPQQIEA